MNDHNPHSHSGHHMPATTDSSLISSLAETKIEHDASGDHSDHSDDAMYHHNNSSTNHHNMTVSMFFHVGEDETILFEFWKISEIGGLIGSMLLIFFLAFTYEALKFYREHLYRHSFQTVQYNTVTVPVENGVNVKETHKTVQIAAPNISCSMFSPPEVTPIFFSQTNCSCSNNGLEEKGNTAKNDYPVSSESDHSNPATAVLPPVFHRSYKVKMLSWMHGWQTLLHVIQVVLSYFLMLIFMTYNIWLCLAVSLGAGAGYFFFGWKKSLVVDITEHCH